MFKQFKKIAGVFQVPNERQRTEAYLSGARDRYDLEYRQRRIDRGEFL